MSILFSVIALSGNKSAAVQSARDDLIAAAVLTIKDGNTRNLDDTAARLRAEGGATKAGEYARNKKGDILRAFIAAHAMAQSARAAYLVQFPELKGKKASAPALEWANARAYIIGDEFEQAALDAIAPKKKAAPAPEQGEQGEQAPEQGEQAPEQGEQAPEQAAPDEFAAFMDTAVKALGKDKIRAIIAAAIAAEQAEEAMQEEEAKKAAPRRRKA